MYIVHAGKSSQLITYTSAESNMKFARSLLKNIWDTNMIVQQRVRSAETSLHSPCPYTGIFSHQGKVQTSMPMYHLYSSQKMSFYSVACTIVQLTGAVSLHLGAVVC